MSQRIIAGVAFAFLAGWIVGQAGAPSYGQNGGEGEVEGLRKRIERLERGKVERKEIYADLGKLVRYEFVPKTQIGEPGRYPYFYNEALKNWFQLRLMVDAKHPGAQEHEGGMCTAAIPYGLNDGGKPSFEVLVIMPKELRDKISQVAAEP